MELPRRRPAPELRGGGDARPRGERERAREERERESLHEEREPPGERWTEARRGRRRRGVDGRRRAGRKNQWGREEVRLGF